MSNSYEEKKVGGLAGTEVSPGLCLRQQHLSSLIASSANISHSVDQSLSLTPLFEKSFHCALVLFLFVSLFFFKFISVNSYCFSFCPSRLPQYADLHASYFSTSSPVYSCRIYLFVSDVPPGALQRNS